MIVRTEEPTDVAAIHRVVAAAFEREDEADLVDRLRERGDGVISLVALDGGKLVGHILFSRMSAPFRALGLAPVAVLPERQRCGIGTRLICAGLDRARQGGWEGIFVLGDPAYYRRFGFDAALARGFQSPYRGPHLMVLALGATLPIAEGVVEYPPAFRSLD
jgi:putative acetyltransferase